MGLFKKAVKSESKLRLALVGPAGSGKTYTALTLATHLAGNGGVAVVDTEHGSASKYADVFEFDVAEMHPPYHPDKYVAAIKEAEQAGYDVIILDSLSHAWSGEGGLLDIVEEISRRMRNPNSFAAWKDATPIHNRLVEAILGAGLHVIITMRAKTEYVIQADEKGRQVPKKVGMAPVQRDGMEYEADIVMEMDIDNNAIVTKSRCPELAGRVFAKPGADVAAILARWLHGENSAVQRSRPKRRRVTQESAPATEADIEHDDNEPLPESLDDVDALSFEDPEPAAQSTNGHHGRRPDWKSPPEAQRWAVEVGACKNEFEARNSWTKIARELHGERSIKPGDLPALYDAFYRRQVEKLAQKEETAA